MKVRHLESEYLDLFEVLQHFTLRNLPAHFQPAYRAYSFREAVDGRSLLRR